MNLPRAALEYWMREYYFKCKYDLGSSGVETYSYGDLRQMLAISPDELDRISLGDSETVGSQGLRQAIARRWGNGDADSVMVTAGSNEILYHLMTSLLEPGDEVVLLCPIYHGLSTVAELKGCDIKLWMLRPENQFVPSIEELGRLITPKTKLVAVNFPHNPTGISISRSQQQALLRLVSSVGAYLLWDAAFEEMTKSPLPNPHSEYDKAITVGTLSKGYGLPGLRVGWCFAPREVLSACVQLRDYTTLYTSPVVEYIGQRCIENADVLRLPRMESARKNKRLLQAWISDSSGDIEWSAPQGGVTCLARFRGVTDTERFCRKLAEDFDVMLVPGKCFGLEKYVRLGFGASCEEFSEGLTRLDDFRKSYKH